MPKPRVGRNAAALVCTTSTNVASLLSKRTALSHPSNAGCAGSRAARHNLKFNILNRVRLIHSHFYFIDRSKKFFLSFRWKYPSLKYVSWTEENGSWKIIYYVCNTMFICLYVSSLNVDTKKSILTKLTWKTCFKSTNEHNKLLSNQSLFR